MHALLYQAAPKPETYKDLELLNWQWEKGELSFVCDLSLPSSLLESPNSVVTSLT